MKTNNIVGKKVREAREEMRFTITDLAEKTGISRITLSKIENGLVERPSRETVVALSFNLHKPIEFFFNENSLSLEATTIPSFRSLASKTNRDNQVAFVKLQRAMLFVEYLYERIAPRPLRISQGLLDEATEISAEKGFDPFAIEHLALRLREEWNLGDNPISGIPTLLENNGIICAPSKLPEKIDSLNVSFKVDQEQESSVIIYKQDDNFFRQRFSLAHELGHILLHHYWTETDFERKSQEAEKQANCFASAFLMPSRRFQSTFLYPTFNGLCALREIWHVSVSAILKRASDLNLITGTQNQNLNIEISRKKKGVKKEEPECVSIEPEAPYYLQNAYAFIFDEGLSTPEDIEDFFALSRSEIVDYIGNQDKFINITPQNIFEMKHSK